MSSLLLRPLAPFQRFQRNARLFLSGTFFVGFGLGTYWVLFNLYLKDLGYGEAVIGRILTLSSAGTFVMALPAAMLINRFATRTILIGAALCASTGYLVMILPVPLPLIMLAAAVAASSFAVHNIAAAPFFMRNSGETERLELFGIHSAVEIMAGVIGAAGGGFLSRWLAPLVGGAVPAFRLTLGLAALLVLVAVLPYLWIREPARTGAATNPRDLLRRTQWRLLFRLSLPKFMTGLGAGLIIPFLNLYFRDRFQLKPDAIGSIFALAQLVTVGAFLVGPHVARRFGMIRAAVATEMLSIPFFLVLAFTQRVEWAILAFWMRGALMNMNQPIADNFAMEMVPREQQATANSFTSLLWHGAWMISAQAGGWLIEHHGFTPPMLATVVLYLAASLTYLAFFHDAEKRIIEPRRRADRSAAEGGGTPAVAADPA